MKELIPYVGGEKAIDRIDQIFSRKMLGSVLVGSTAGKIVEKIIELISNTTFSALIAWIVAFIIAVVLFVWWDEIQSATVDTAGDAKEKVSDTIE
jgi:ABC-type dipeptide/oligopeptide/nickel transport system permease component